MSTIQLHRVIKAPINKVFRAFSNPVATASWIPPNGFLCEIQQFDFVENGHFRMSFYNFTTQESHSFGGKYITINTNEFLKYTDVFDDPNLKGEMITTVTFKSVMCGTEIIIIQDGIPDLIPAEMCYIGWQESLEKLIKLVEPEINQ